LIVAVKFPAVQHGTTAGFAELSRRHGDFAMVGPCRIADVQRDRIDSARLVYFGCVDRAKVARCGLRRGRRASPAAGRFRRARRAISQDLAPDDTPDMRADTKLSHRARC
jgi:carbon-monoxide dehydrogenase medium subunit